MEVTDRMGEGSGRRGVQGGLWREKGETQGGVDVEKCTSPQYTQVNK